MNLKIKLHRTSLRGSVFAELSLDHHHQITVARRIDSSVCKLLQTCKLFALQINKFIYRTDRNKRRGYFQVCVTVLCPKLFTVRMVGSYVHGLNSVDDRKSEWFRKCYKTTKY
ncbi:hypothetical protein RF11_02778 [Thelohanellus kitauei]|uniref:Uncharacterized protein n=1 Tax=Thelohanellus kitauei TaxID=669202 RepID=A0A0C2MXU8_THEKT|nr:hypothetical protein RF11_02778 [Thelohanellus kitauei]